MAIEKRYDLKGAHVVLASLRQQELFWGSFRRALFFKSDLIKIKVSNQEIDRSNAVKLIQTSPGCYQLVFVCNLFKLRQPKLQFSISVYYDNSIRKTYEIILTYPKHKASFIVEPNLKEIVWGKLVPCGLLKVIPSSDNIGVEWWQYEKKESVYIACNDHIAIDGAQLVEFGGKKCYKYDIANPSKGFVIPVKYVGNNRSHEGNDNVAISYYINNQWANGTFCVKGRTAGFNISLHRVVSQVNVSRRTVIFKLIVRPEDPFAPEIKALNVRSSNDIISIKPVSGNDWEFDLTLETEKINFYPINLRTDIIVDSSNAGKKVEHIEIVSTKANDDRKVELQLNEDFYIAIREEASTLEELSSGIEIGIKNESKFKLNGIDIAIFCNAPLCFTSSNSSSKRLEIINQKQIKLERIQCVHTSKKKLQGHFVISISGSDYNQTIPFEIPILQKHINKPTVRYEEKWDNSNVFNGNKTLFECVVVNTINRSESIREIENISVSDFSCKKGFELVQKSTNHAIAPGKSCIFCVKLTEPVKQNCSKEFILYYKNEVIGRQSLFFYHPIYTPKLKAYGKRFKFPQGDFRPFPVAAITFEESGVVATSKASDLIVKLPPLVRTYTIKSKGFFANDNLQTFSEDQGNHTIYLDPNEFCDSEALNIPAPVECICELIISEPDGSENVYKPKFILTPLDASPIIEYQYNDTIKTIGQDFSIANLDVYFASSKIKNGRSQDFLSINLINAQSLPFPIQQGTVRVEISKQLVGVIIKGKKVTIPCDIFKLSSNEITLQNGAQDQIIFCIDFGEYMVLKSKNLGGALYYLIEFTLQNEIGKKSIITIKGKLREEVFGEWYALDLGTTGIVLAHKGIDGKITPVAINKRIEDESIPLLETDSNIISSIMGIHQLDDNGNRELKLEKDRDAVVFSELILPAAKFIVGQKEIPYIQRLEDLNTLQIFDSEGTENVTPDLLISELYHHILGFVSASDVKRLTLTYPNTYTGEQVTRIKSLISEKHPHLQSYVNAVPESDAVLAHYLTLRTNPGSPRKFNSDKENIVIYDMGAGTLDISYVEFRFDSKEHKGTASIVKKIGIPVAGNYLNLVIFKALKESLGSNNRQWDAKKRKVVIEDLKSSENILSAQILPYSFKEGIKGMSGEDIINSPYMSTYLDFCCKRVFEVLFGTKDWKNNIDTFVFSGRASRFVPLRRRIENELNASDDSQLIDSLTISDSELKKSVAIGAIEYTNSYSSEDGLHQFKIESRSQYHKIYCIYQSYGDFANRVVKCVKLIDPEIAEWDKVPVVNGTKSMNLSGSERINLHPESTKITLVQTLLSPEDLENLYTKLWFPNGSLEIIEDDCFVNEILSIPVSELGKDLNSVLISLNVDEDNNIDLKINNSRYLGEKVRESIESNRYYNVNFTLESE